MLTLFERGLIAHLVADWLLQNDWMARHKSDLRHPAAWAHGSICALTMGLALGWRAGVVLGGVHMLIDTRRPLAWWGRIFRQTGEGRDGWITAVGADQVLHVTAVALWTAWMN